jgi:tRNA A37 threonylcarbamoyladenosine biosynthesis protein TsaE
VGRIAALLDFEQLFADICLVEWPERLGEALVRSPCRAARSPRAGAAAGSKHTQQPCP